MSMREQASLGNLKGATIGQVANGGLLSSACLFLNTHDSSFEMSAWWGSMLWLLTSQWPYLFLLWKTSHDKGKTQHSKKLSRLDSKSASLSPACFALWRSVVILVGSKMTYKISLDFALFSHSYLNSAIHKGGHQWKQITISLLSAWHQHKMVFPWENNRHNCFCWALQWCS